MLCFCSYASAVLRGTLLVAALIPASGLLAASTAVAQQPAACEGGRVASAATAGRCCWPNQVWSAERGRCEGPPACPAGTMASGDDCVASAVPAPPAESAQMQPQPAPQQQYPTAQSTYPGYQSAPPQQVDTGETRPTLGLVIGGISAFVAAWAVVSFISAFAIDLGSDEAAVNFIPIAGPLVCIASCGVESATLASLLVFDSIVQVAGVAMFIAGFAIQRPVYSTVSEGEGGLDLAVVPWFDRDRIGASLLGTTF